MVGALRRERSEKGTGGGQKKVGGGGVYNWSPAVLLRGRWGKLHLLERKKENGL